MTVASVGYEGRSIEEFVAHLQRRGVDLVADVRLNAISRRPGFSKTALRTALAAAGIDYLHLRALGNPRENRPAFGGDDVEAGRAVYRQLLEQPHAAAELRQLSELAGTRRVAVMCVEADEARCHRRVVLAELRAPEISAVDELQ